MTSRNLLSSPIVQHLSSAAIAGAVVYLKPARVPRTLRRVLLATNTGGSAAAMLVGSSRTPASGKQPAPLAHRAGAKSDSLGDTALLLASVASSATLLTSKPALKLDRRVEKSLTRRGVGRPRLVMALGAAGVVVVIGAVTDRITKAAERKVAELQEAEQKPAKRSVVPDQHH
ncbi:hypothetical protein [Demetria terragena]|uniref:hypothetical protein n=1 Tax=Demetria terragena TaxID=63959 RepID=UPI0003674CCF|nr:hypothetical protein [Demetria terragena]